MGHPAYSQAPREGLASRPLGDANRGSAYLALQTAVSNLGRARRTDPPSDGFFPRSGAGSRVAAWASQLQ